MKPNSWVSSSQAEEMLTRQLTTWSLARDNYKAYKGVQVKSFDLGGFTVKVQFNPSRLVSSCSKVDEKSIRERRCFLCLDNLPIEQERLLFGTDYLVLCNPFPIFPQHFTIPSREHKDQLILPCFTDLLELAFRLDKHTLFYNGPKSGASAPDHLHFQAGTRSYMPLDDEVDKQLTLYGKTIQQEGNNTIQTLTHYLRNGFVIKAESVAVATLFFERVYFALNKMSDDTEPKMNLFVSYQNKRWRVVVIPRKKHRPWQYEVDAERDDHMLSSPGSADIGGLFITPMEKDFKQITPESIANIYQQVCFNNEEIVAFADKIAK